MKQQHPPETAAWTLFLILFLGASASELSAAEAKASKLSRTLRSNGSETMAGLTTLAPLLNASTVSILDDGDVVALGTILRGDGWVGTKASELGWKTSVQVASGEELVPVSVVVDEENDFAMIRLDTRFDGVHPIGLRQPLIRGKILVSHASPKKRLGFGIISANRRGVERVGGVLGVELGREGLGTGGVEVFRVVEETAAARAGILRGDVISSVNGKVVLLREQVIEEVGSHHPGDNVIIQLKRGDQTLDLNVILGYRSTAFGNLDRNQRLSGVTSTRLSGFKEIIQHDIPVSVKAMGGPVIDLEGNIVGINIARADRVTTYALSVSILQQLLEQLDEEESLELGD